VRCPRWACTCAVIPGATSPSRRRQARPAEPQAAAALSVRTGQHPDGPRDHPEPSPSLGAEGKQVTHAIRMAACDAETTLTRTLEGHSARADDEAYALTREALTTSGDIIPDHPGPDLVLRYEFKTHPGIALYTSLCQES
jgi:hypothetical protein